ncbi:prevent-host-death family protein [Cryobacterium sp. MP_M5]|uniref:type II toxin-antitoxin system Phd/YefM family antitoxin n=1 Tax=unclassified Cryobacterium TaxID=2649013 RepID=UPI001A1A3588|nr:MULTISPECIES: type II toxin-antitoxin system Phd/YefM family antitoxin [unclassified Cryobacterium]MBG6059454.1 prevent-host-death family protein [Cryobacterium sp. MP_M3]MEC5177567.1 prevent-host-death family protein [Cryobacterium sp. MP_M5]
MYDPNMSSIDPVSVSDARGQLAAIIDRARTEHEPVFLSRRGRRVAAVIDSEDLERLIGLAEDMADIRAAEESREEMRRTRAEPTPWDQVKADLGLV